MLTQQVAWHVDEVGYHPVRLAAAVCSLECPSANRGPGVVGNGVMDRLRGGVLDEDPLVRAGKSCGYSHDLASLSLDLRLHADQLCFEFA